MKRPGTICETIPRRWLRRGLSGAWWRADIPHSDTAEYKMWGNGMALPNALYVMEGFIENNTAESGEEDK